MIWLLALVNGGLVFLVAMPGEQVRATPWDAPSQAIRDRWEGFRSSQTSLAISSGLNMDPVLFLVLRLGAVAVGAVAAGFLFGPVSFVCGGTGGWLVVQEWLRSRREARLWLFADQFREVLQSVVNSLRAGRAIGQAMEQALEDLLRIPGRERDLMALELTRVVDELTLGSPLDTVLQGLAARIPLEEVRLFTDAVMICRIRGGNLVHVLQTLMGLNVDRFQVRQEVRVLTSEKRAEGSIVALMPVVMLVLLSLIAPDYMHPLTGTVVGQALIGVGLLMVLVAHMIIRKLVRIEV
ncbi:MAG TPA: type II secretion system F family protein [Symbiobacteriaceae bacterium]